MRARAWWNVLQSDLTALRGLLRDPQATAPWPPDELFRMTYADLRGFQREFALALELAPYVRWLPRYGHDLAAFPTLLEMALDLSESGALLSQSLSPLLSPQRQGAGYTLETTLALLDEAQPQLAYTADALARVRQARATLDVTRLSPRLAGWLKELDALLPRVEQGVQGALLLPRLLGAAQTRTYLLLVHNEDELRPAGGFLTGVARITLREGRIEQLYFENSAEVTDFKRPYPDPPDPLREIMGLDLWVFHDSNWSPDFPTSARVAVAFYQHRYATPIDGVLALDQEGFRQWMEVLQPLNVDSYPEPLTAENILPALRQSRDTLLEPDPLASWEHLHKAFLEDVLNAAVQKLQEQPESVDFARLGLAVITAFEERHLFAVAFEDAEAAALLQQARWDGALYRGAGDFVMAVDANLGYNKVNPYIAESLAYSVDLRDLAQPQATLTLRYQHRGPQSDAYCYHFQKADSLTYEQLMQHCYWDYARIFVPAGSRLISATPNPVPGRMLVTGKGRSGEPDLLPDEAGKSVFGTFFVLPPGQSAETRFAYALPAKIIEPTENGIRYHLYIQKQGGQGEIPVQITVAIPPAARVLHSSLPVDDRAEGQLVFTQSLKGDLDLTLDIAP